MDRPIEIHDAPDLREMDESEQHREVYAWAGLALYYGQVLEESFIALIFTTRATDGSLTEFASRDDFFEMHAAMTMGQLFRHAREHLDLAEDLDEQTREALARRNFLVHHFFKERIERSVTLEGRQSVVEELRSYCVLFRDTDDALTDVMFRYGERFGFTPDLVEREVERWKAEFGG